MLIDGASPPTYLTTLKSAVYGLKDVNTGALGLQVGDTLITAALPNGTDLRRRSEPG